ncbi:hypothetical protein [Bacillus suaedaesalsae]|uniref:YqgU-like 6-bladed beta-propeller domain-containing protein n=1 Tax=Bacillus suaedaesalsae TaxID=2810349 RepID=A0ABS2DFN7_9BACI|nr:hypothetical protein [Bacillus suaedaesalsae]MBM6617264.1 hypothetical protein [Bacillus suaedaesalsae]
MDRIAMLFVLVSVLLCGCSSFQAEGMKPASSRESFLANKMQPDVVNERNNLIVPIQSESVKFQSVVDWYNYDHLLYIVNDELGAKVFKHHIYTGNHELFFEITDPIITLQSSPSNDHFLIHTSNSSNEAKLIIVDDKGEVLLDWEVESAELQYVWNPFDENKIFITSFLEDWTFKNYILNMEQKKVDENNLPHPFIQWMSSTTIAYLKWEDAFTEAPLFLANINGDEEEKLGEQIFAFHSYKDIFLTISAKNESINFQFSKSSTMEKLHEFTLPVINTYSDNWWIPNYDYDPIKKKFYYFKPITENNEVQSLDLISFSIETGEEETILPNMEDQPIKISSDGEKLLLGYQYNTIIELKSKNTSTLIN